MKVIIVLLYFFALYLPVFGKLLPPFQQRQETFLNYGLPVVVMVAAISIVCHFVFGGADRKTKDPLFAPFLFLGFGAMVWLFKGLDADIADLVVLGILRTKLAGLIYGLAAIAVLYSLPDKLRYSRFIPLLLAGIFLAQLALSMVESFRGVGFAKYEIGNVGLVGLEGRDVLDVIGGSDLIGLGFQIPFSGQIGQHNGFGNQLPFYLLIFLSLLVERRGRWWVFGLAVAVLFALIGNTTRVALLAGVISLVLVLPSVAGNRRLFIGIVTALLVAAVFAMLCVYWDRLVDMTAKMDSMSSRLVLWQMVIDDSVQSMTVWSGLFGFGPKTLLTIGAYFRGDVLGSLENQFLALWADFGVLGLGGFIWVFVWRPLVHSWTSRPAARRLCWAFVAVILICGATMDLHMHFTSIVLLLIAYDRVFYAMQHNPDSVSSLPPPRLAAKRPARIAGRRLPAVDAAP